MTENTVYAIWLAQAIGAASSTYRKLFIHYGDDPCKIYKESSFDGLSLRQGTIEKLLDKDLSEALEIYGRCERNGISIVGLTDMLYPKALLNIPDRPYLLYMKGCLRQLNDELCVGVVGTRNASPFGKRVTRELVAELSRCNATIISGLAYGIDSEAHRACLDVGGFTAAVLGCGHEKARRWDNGELLNRIEAKGMIISEYPPQAGATKYTYPQRNRIISGISRALLVTEASLKSGALITANYARRQGRRVFASVSSGLPSFAGTAELLKSGAMLASCAEDIIGGFEKEGFTITNPELERVRQTHLAKQTEAQKPKQAILPDSSLTEPEKAIRELLSADAVMTTDELVQQLSLTVEAVNEALTMLEINGLVVSMPGQRYKAVK